MFLTARLAEKNNPTINYCVLKHVTIFFGYYDPGGHTKTIDILYISYNISIIWQMAIEMAKQL